MTERYIGIENEFTSFEKGCRTFFSEGMFGRLKSGKDYHIARTAIRTPEGLAFYIDGEEIELCTPPIRINKGFATRLTDILMIGRDKLAKAVDDYELTGYSMHWNISTTGKNQMKSSDSMREFFDFLGVPFSLLTLTPLSCGIGHRIKGCDDYERNEILTDSIYNEEQIRAAALFLGAYSCAFDAKKRVPLDAEDLPGAYDMSYVHPVPDGRTERIRLGESLEETDEIYEEDVWTERILPTIERDQKKISAQGFLEAAYAWMEPYVDAVASKSEKQNLEDFIQKRKKLEIDRHRYYAALEKAAGYDDGTYYPEKFGKQQVQHTLKPSNIARELPIEGQLLGAIVSELRHGITSMNWNGINLKPNTIREDSPLLNDTRYKLQKTFDGTYLIINNIRDIYTLGKNLIENHPELEETPDMSGLWPRETPIETKPWNEKKIVLEELVSQIVGDAAVPGSGGGSE